MSNETNAQEQKKGILIVGEIDLNDDKNVKRLFSIINALLQKPTNYYPLEVKNDCCFKIANSKLKVPPESGWYIILDGNKPLYVGKAKNLDERLNSDNGSRDNFANTNRDSDPERNFIKRFKSIQIFKKLRVCVITQKEVIEMLSLKKGIIKRSRLWEH